LLQQILDKQTQLEAGITSLVGEVKAMRQSLEELVNLLKFERPGGEGAPAVQVVLPPVSPGLLSDILRTMRWSGEIYFPHFKTVTHVPAGTQVVFHFKLPSGYYCTCPGPLIFDSDYYDPDITLDAYVDGEPITALGALPIYPSGPIQFTYGGLWFKRTEVTVVYTNNSLRDANISYAVDITMIKDTIYDMFYRPFIEFTKQRVSEMIVLGGGQPL
jgi:hypothetical protein